MTRRIIILGVLVSGTIGIFAGSLFGQDFGSPALSPWLYLNQRQGGPIDNYHMYVQPQQQIRSTLQNQQADIQHNGVSADAVIDHLTAQQAFNASGAPTGVTAGFLNHGTYFNTNRLQNSGVSGAPGGAYGRRSGPGMPGGGGGQVGTPSLSGVGSAGIGGMSGLGGLGR